MTKLIAALVACTFSIGAFAQMASAPMGKPSGMAPMGAASGMSSGMAASKPMMKKHHMKKHHGKKTMKKAASAPA